MNNTSHEPRRSRIVIHDKEKEYNKRFDHFLTNFTKLLESQLPYNGGNKKNKNCFATSELEEKLKNIQRDVHFVSTLPPDQYFNYFFSIVQQVGPCCGVAAIMTCLSAINRLINRNDQIVNESFGIELLNFLYDNRLSNRGEIMTNKYMRKLAVFAVNQLVDRLETTKNIQCEISIENVDNLLIDIDDTNQLDLALVAYDKDKNNGPCQRTGEKAHWSCIVGKARLFNGNKYLLQKKRLPKDEFYDTYVIALQGKSKLFGIWSRSKFIGSNKQLQRIPERYLHKEDNGNIISQLQVPTNNINCLGDMLANEYVRIKCKIN
ncbi:hypothetical protein SNEBB_003435 [Seison nebaliae]|nr:hypothetical protein SNEBB_003435 [Seison nebaliae]